MRDPCCDENFSRISWLEFCLISKRHLVCFILALQMPAINSRWKVHPPRLDCMKMPIFCTMSKELSIFAEALTNPMCRKRVFDTIFSFAIFEEYVKINGTIS